MSGGYCATPDCNWLSAYRSIYCNDCMNLRFQHATSHRLDGHSAERIFMCPSCETADRAKSQVEDLLG